MDEMTICNEKVVNPGDKPTGNHHLIAVPLSVSIFVSFSSFVWFHGSVTVLVHSHSFLSSRLQFSARKAIKEKHCTLPAQHQTVDK